MLNQDTSVSDLYIIAEAGSNHNGDERLARQLVDAGVVAGADAIKFQFINPEGLYLPAYFNNGMEAPNPVFGQRARERLGDDAWARVAAYALERTIPFSASVFDAAGLKLLKSLDPPFVKVASTDLNNIALLSAVADSGLRAIVSTGMSTLSEVERAINVFQRMNALDALTILHCVSIYPCPLEDAGVGAVRVLRDAFGVRVGYSDHTQGYSAAVAAIACGAQVIEKHLTTDQALPGFDHAHAANPQQFTEFVAVLRKAHRALSSVPRARLPAEAETRLRARRGLYAARDLPAGHVLSLEDILVVRPEGPLGPSDVDRILGQPTKQPIRRYQPFALDEGVTPGPNSWQRADAYWRTEMQEKGISFAPRP